MMKWSLAYLQTLTLVINLHNTYTCTKFSTISLRINGDKYDAIEVHSPGPAPGIDGYHSRQ